MDGEPLPGKPLCVVPETGRQQVYPAGDDVQLFAVTPHPVKALPERPHERTGHRPGAPSSAITRWTSAFREAPSPTPSCTRQSAGISAGGGESAAAASGRQGKRRAAAQHIPHGKARSRMPAPEILIAGILARVGGAAAPEEG